MSAAARARAFNRAARAAVCDSIRPWEHGTVLRATPYPGYHDFNLVRVEDEPGMDVGELVAFADRALDGLEHRRMDFEDIDAAEPRRAGFEARGWKVVRLLWMLHDGSPQQAAAGVETAPYEAADVLRRIWHEEDHADEDPARYLAAAREVSERRAVQVIVARDGAEAIAFAQLERDGDAAEIASVYVHPDHRGRGLGTALTRAAIAAAGDVGDLWIVADDEDRAKDLYARLGFRPVWRSMECTLWPER